MLSPSGKPFSEESIGMALAMRGLHRHVREVTGKETAHAGFTAKNRSRFLNELENLIQTIKRKPPVQT